jgi:hypothetical protein
VGTVRHLQRLHSNFCSLHKPVLIFHPTVNRRASDRQMLAVSGTALLTQRTAQLLFVDINRGLWRGLGGGGCLFWLHRETMTFICHAAYQNAAVIQIGVNKIPPNFDTGCDVFKRRSALKG